MLTGRRCAVLGSPVAHSLSPVIHRAAYEWLGLDWRYDAVEVDEAGFDAFVDSLDGSWRGLSCTMPLKEVAALAGTPDEDVVLTGAANTVLLDAPRTVHNTDIPGLIDAFRAAGVSRVEHAAILGNGATARSAVVALARLGARGITVLGRNPERVGQLVSWAQDAGLPASAGAWSEGVPGEAEALVSTVPAAAAATVLPATAPAPEGRLRAVFDVIYHPWPTPLAAAAQASGVLTLNGLDLLVHQAAHQLKHMTGQIVPVSVLESAVRAEVLRRSAT